VAIKIVISDTVGFKVRGSINNESGIPQPFDFFLTCVRLDHDAIQTKLKSDSDASVIDFMVDVIESWVGVRDADDKPMDYTEAAYRKLCKIHGVAQVVFQTYLTEVGAKAKN